MGSPPGPRLQRLNALLHREPLASIAHSLYWSLVLLLATPVIVVILHVQGIVNLLVWSMGWTGDGYYDPRRRQQEGSPPNTELAVIITGCDSGFGKEFALWADRAGYTVFAGCLSKESFAQFEEGCRATMIPVLLDVTREEDVRKAVTTVESWLAEGSTAGTNNRLLHAVCNNAGIIMPGLVDWIDVATVERVMDGTRYHSVHRRCPYRYTNSLSSSLPFLTYSQFLWNGTLLQGIFATSEKAVREWGAYRGPYYKRCLYGWQSDRRSRISGLRGFQTRGCGLFTWLAKGSGTLWNPGVHALSHFSWNQAGDRHVKPVRRFVEDYVQRHEGRVWRRYDLASHARNGVLPP
jgi:NAD(P)-dependent dehydrogenase (short-subunit alcohol dehydrogenase family)